MGDANGGNTLPVTTCVIFSAGKHLNQVAYAAIANAADNFLLVTKVVVDRAL